MDNAQITKSSKSLRKRFDAVNEHSLSFDENMRIAKLEWILYDDRQDKSKGNPHYQILLRITANSDVEGLCLLPGWHVKSCTLEYQKPFSELLIGKNPLAHESIWELLYSKGLSLSLISYVDVALWDLYGKLEGKPVHELLGTQRTKVKV